MKMKFKLSDKKVASAVKNLIDQKVKAYLEESWASNPLPELDEAEAPSMQENIDGDKPPVYEENIIYREPEQSGNGYSPIPKAWDSEVSNGYAPGTRTNTEKTEGEQLVDQAEEQLESCSDTKMGLDIEDSSESQLVTNDGAVELVIDGAELDKLLV